MTRQSIKCSTDDLLRGRTLLPPPRPPPTELTSGCAFKIAIRLERCGSSVYIHKKSSPSAIAALDGSGSSIEISADEDDAESSSVVTPELTTDSSLGETWRLRCVSGLAARTEAAVAAVAVAEDL